MSATKVHAGPLFKSTSGLIAFLCLGFLLCSAQPGQAQALNLFKNYFVTGDYMVAGVGMRGTGVLGPVTQEKWKTATISMSGVPENADILAALLYWSALERAANPFSADGFFMVSQLLRRTLAQRQVLRGAGAREVVRAQRAGHRL